MKWQKKRTLDEQAESCARSAGKSGVGDDEKAKESPGMVECLPSAWRHGWPLGLLLVAAVLIAYHPAWHGEFIWDDESHIVHNRLLFEPDGLKRIWFSREAPQYYPLVFTSFRLERALWGLNPAGYHFVNLLLHSTSALLLWRLLRQLRVRGAWLAAAVFALHPVDVESVAWITERKNTLSMVFFVLSLLWYSRFDQQTSAGGGQRSETANPRPPELNPQLCYGLSLLAFTLALLSKTAVAPLPVVLWLLAWWRRGRVAGRDVWRSVPFFTVALMLIPLTVLFEHQAGSEIVRSDSFWSRLAGAGWAVWFYLYKAVLPLHLTFVYPRWRIDASRTLSYVPGLLLVAGFLVCWRFRQRWGKALLFGLGYFVVMLLPALGFVNISAMRFTLVSDTWQYFAIIGPIALGAALMVKAAERLHTPTLLYALGGMALAVLSVLTWQQSKMYTDIETLWQTSLRRNPNAWLPQYNLGTLLGMNGKLDEAVKHFREAIRIEPTLPSPYYNLAMAYALQHRMDDAMASDKEAMRLEPNNPNYLNFLAWIYATNPRAELRNGAEAVRLAERACQLTKRQKTAMLDTLAAAYAAAGRFEEAAKTTEETRALALSTHDPATAETARQRLELYKAGKPYRDGP